MADIFCAALEAGSTIASTVKAGMLASAGSFTTLKMSNKTQHEINYTGKGAYSYKILFFQTRHT